MIGKTLSHYKVIEKIGSGGMGVVYRAEDTTLKREVAIKVLPEQFTKDPQRLARFEREAQLLAQLNHPNIAAIYGLEEAEGVRFLALELVEGETLAERVARGRLPVEEALEACRQIAEGVEAAHEKGVIHRDLKPANVKLTPEGTIKILDFGLAKAFEGEMPAADISHSPTLTEEMTRAGAILGTAAYMSPEQARGEEVDKRADIFAFGCVLYELLTGKRAFGGKTVTDTLAKILEGVPDWDALPENTPWRIQELLSRCLTKDPDDRLLHIGEARIQIKKAFEEPAPALPVAGVSTAQPSPWTKAIPWSTALVIAVAAGVGFWILTRPLPQPLKKFVITPSSSTVLTNFGGNEVAISPDGRHVVYRVSDESGPPRLQLRSLDDFVDRMIPGTENAEAQFFSPNGQWVGFFANGKLLKVALAGGTTLTLYEGLSRFRGGSWDQEDNIVFATEGGGLYRVSAAGGEAEQLAVVNADQGETGYRGPHILPGGKTVLFTIHMGLESFQIALLSLETGELKIVIENGKEAVYTPTGHLVYSTAVGETLMAAPFDLARLEVTGDSVPILERVRSPSDAAVDYAISDDGTLVYVPAGGVPELHQHSLVWVDRQGTETSVTQEKKEFRVPRFSPDGKLISFSVGLPSDNQLWIYDVEAESLSRFTFDEERSGSAAWSPDNKWLIFQSGRAGAQGMVRQPADRSVPPERLTSTPDSRHMPNSWSRDGRFLAFSAGGNPTTGTTDIGILALEGDNEPEYIIATPALECCPKFSPDGKWLAYLSDESGRQQVYVRPFPGPEVKWLISEEDEGGGQPVWSPDGRELFYRSGDKTMVVSIQTQDQTLRAGSPRVLFEGQYVSHSNPVGFQFYDISPDGKRFLMLKEGELPEEPNQINVVINWFEELKRLVPVD